MPLTRALKEAALDAAPAAPLTADGLTRDDKHRYRWQDGALQPGVTNIVGTLDKSAPLMAWKGREVAACAVRNLPLLTQLVDSGGADAAQKWLQGIPDRQKDAAADLGTRVHAIADAIAKGEAVEIDPDIADRIEAYRRWQDRAKPRIIGTEYMVYSEKHLYGGTADMAVEIAGEKWLIDIKTGKNVYAETALQLVALDRADFVGRPGDKKKYPVPRAQHFGVLWLPPAADAELVPYDVTDAEWQCFLALRVANGWRTERAAKVKTGGKVWND